MKEEMHSALVTLSFSGNFDPILMAAEIGLPPTKIRELKMYPDGPKASVSYASKAVKGESLNIYQIVDDLLFDFHPLAQSISSILRSAPCDVYLSVVLEISTKLDGSTPAIGLSEEAVKLLALLGASLDVDAYLLQ